MELLWPVFSGIFGGIVALAGAEFVRRQARKETYAEHLWREKVNRYSRLIACMHELGGNLHVRKTLPSVDAEKKATNSVREFTTAFSPVSVIGGKDFIQHATEFLLATQPVVMSGNSHEYHVDDMIFHLEAAVDAARKELGVEKLEHVSLAMFGPQSPPGCDTPSTSTG